MQCQWVMSEPWRNAGDKVGEAPARVLEGGAAPSCGDLWGEPPCALGRAGLSREAATRWDAALAPVSSINRHTGEPWLLQLPERSLYMTPSH